LQKYFLFLHELSDADLDHALVVLLLLTPDHLLVLQLSKLFIHGCQVRVKCGNHVVVLQYVFLRQFGGVFDVHWILGLVAAHLHLLPLRCFIYEVLLELVRLHRAILRVHAANYDKFGWVVRVQLDHFRVKFDI